MNSSSCQWRASASDSDSDTDDAAWRTRKRPQAARAMQSRARRQRCSVESSSNHVCEGWLRLGAVSTSGPGPSVSSLPMRSHSPAWSVCGWHKVDRGVGARAGNSILPNRERLVARPVLRGLESP